MRVNAESRVFFSESLQRGRHLFLIQFRLRLDRHGNNRIRKRWRLEQNGMVLVAKRIAGGDVLDSNDGGDVARITGLDIFALVCLDLY